MKLSVFAVAALIATEPVLSPVLKKQGVSGQAAGRILSAAHQTTVASVGEQTLIKGRPVEVTGDSRKHLLAILN